MPHNPDYNPIQRRDVSRGGRRTLICFRSCLEMNITLTDLEIMENEMAVNSGRMSADSNLSQKACLTNARAALTTSLYRSMPSSNSTQQKEMQQLKERTAQLESALEERDRLVALPFLSDV